MRPAIIILAVLLSFTGISKTSHAVEADKAGTTIKECREKIAAEREAILADEQRLREAKKTGDKAQIEQVKQETDQDIKKRKSAIRVLYRKMDTSSWFRGNSGGKIKVR